MIPEATYASLAERQPHGGPNGAERSMIEQRLETLRAPRGPPPFVPDERRREEPHRL
jgi:hypothetical protein